MNAFVEKIIHSIVSGIVVAAIVGIVHGFNAFQGNLGSVQRTLDVISEKVGNVEKNLTGIETRVYNAERNHENLRGVVGVNQEKLDRIRRDLDNRR